MSTRYQVSVSPHVRDSLNTSKIMFYVVMALLPASLCGVYNYGLHALLILLVSVSSAVLAEYVWQKLMKKEVTISDWSAVLTGLLIGLNMPPAIAWWIPAAGSVFAIIVIKQLYGGLGQNFMNPALGARCFLLISFSGQMTAYTGGRGISSLVTGLTEPALSFTGRPLAPETVDALSGATPLKYLKAGAVFDLKSLFFGQTLGVIGESSACAILIGAVILITLKIIEVRIPLTYLGSFFVLCVLTGISKGYVNPLFFAAEELFAGGIMLGAWFMATDYVTSPCTERGQLVYGLLLGVLTWLFRLVSTSSAEGVSYAIIFANCLVPMIEELTRPRAFGIPGKRRFGKEDRT